MEPDATDAVLGSVVLIVGTTLLRRVMEHKPTTEPLVYGFVLATVLLLINLVSPRLAMYLAVMGTVGALVVNGPAVAKFLKGFKP
jgi:hypothetical protein